MAWDDTAPTAQELASNPMSGGGGWDSSPPTQEELGVTESPAFDPQGLEKERAAGGNAIDATVADAMTVDGLAGLGKLGAGLAAKGVGGMLNTVIPAASKNIPGIVGDLIPNTENIVPTVGRVANDQTLKSFGGTMGQLQNMAKGRGGQAALDDAAEYARDKGLADVWSTSIGREKALKGLKDATGKTVGDLRNEAGPAPSGIIDKIVGNPKIDKYLGKGSASKELGGVDTALNDIKEVGGDNPTHSSLADAATYINENAAGNKLYQPVNGETDVANILSHENNAGIAQTLGSDKAKQYVDALDEQSKLHPLEHLQEKGELRERGARGGLGTRFIQAIADQFGYRMSAKGAGALHDALVGKGLLEKAPGIAAKSVAKMVPGSADDINQKVRDFLIRERGD